MKLKKKISDILELVVFKHSIFALPFIFIAMFVSSKFQNNSIWFGSKLFILGLLCAISARNFAMAFNRLVDIDIDKLNPRCKNRPSVDGRINKITIVLFIIFNALIFIISAFFINKISFIVSFFILFILASYSFFKRFSSLAHLILGISLALAPLCGTLAISAKIYLWCVFLSFGIMFWVAGFDILYSLQDMDYDKEQNLFSIPSIYGQKASMFISSLFHFLTILFWIFFCIEARLGIFAYVGVIISAIILIFEHIIINRDFKNINRAFFTLNGYLGIIFLIFIILDLIV